MTPCPCGGVTYVDEFQFPRRERVYFLRCEACQGMSDTAKTEKEAEALTITRNQNGEPK